MLTQFPLHKLSFLPGNLLQSLLGGDNLEDEGSTGQSSSQGPASSCQAMEMDQPDLD